MKLSPVGRAKLKSYESFASVAYIPVPGDRWTIGYGFTEGVVEGMRMTRAQADARLTTELLKYEQAVYDACKVEPNQNQFDAMVCLAWNIGIEGFLKSSVLKAHNRGDTQAAARAFALWNKSGGVVYAGLTRRRGDEAATYLKPVPGVIQRTIEGAVPDAMADELPADPMPQRIDAEKPMSESSINRAGIAAGGTAAVSAISQISEAVNQTASLKSGVDQLGHWLVPALTLAVVGLCAYIVWNRFQMRKEGRA